MNKILLYTDWMGAERAYDISLPKLREEAYLAVFRDMDAAGEFGRKEEVPAAFQIYDMAQRGNPDYAAILIQLFRKQIRSNVRELNVIPDRPVQTAKVKKVECPEALLDTNVPEVR